MTFLKGKKFTKFKKGRNKGISNSKLFFCNYGIKSLDISKITKNQIESARKVLSKNIKGNGRILIRVYPDISKTKKPIEVRMGSGKGDIDKYIYRIKPGTIIFEFDTNLCIRDINRIVYLACRKLPFSAFLISKEKQNFF